MLQWLIAFFLIAAPWNVYCAISYPIEFNAEFGLIFSHLSGNVENWASPWDRLWFQHLPSALYEFWATSLVAALLLTFRAVQLKKWLWLFAPIWIAAVLIPFTLAISKTPTATLIAWPALTICIGFLIWRASQGYLVELLTALALFIAATFFTGKFVTIGIGVIEPGSVMRQAEWIIWHVAAGAGVAGIALLLFRDARIVRRRMLVAALVVASLATPAWRTLEQARRVAKQKATSVVTLLGGSLPSLPQNAVIFVTQRGNRERNEIMFDLDRTAYALPNDQKIAENEFKAVRLAGDEVWIFTGDSQSARLFRLEPSVN